MWKMARKVFKYPRVLIALLLLSSPIFKSEGSDYRRTVITDPNISRRCEILTEKRKEKLATKQRIQSLIDKNKHLQKITPIEKVSIKEKLQVNLGHLEHELELAVTQIQYQEETIVRKGCPGITL